MVISMDVTSDQTMSSSPPVDHLGEPGGANQSPSPFQSQSSASGQVAGGGIVSAETDGGGGDEHEDEHSKCSGQTIVTSQHHYHQKQQQQQQTQPPQHLQQEQMLSSGQNPEKTTTGGSEQQQQEHERMVLSSGGSSFDEDDKRLMMSVDADEYDLEQDDQEQEAVSGTAGMRANLRLEQAELEAQLTAQAKSTRFRQATTGVSSSGRVGETREIVESSLVAQMRDIVEGGGGASSSSASAGLKRVPAPEQTRSSSGSQVMINDDDNNNEDVEVDVDDEDEDDETRGANRTTKAEPTGNENQGAKSGPKPKSSSDSLNNQNENGHSRASIDTASQKRLRHSRAHCRHHHHHNHHGHHGHHHHGHHHHHHHHGHHSHHHHHRHRQSVSGGSLPGQVDSGSGAGAELATSKPASSSHPPHHQHSHPHSHHHHHGHSHGGHGWHRHPNSSHPHHHHQNQQQHEHKRGITSKRSFIQPLSMATIEPSTGTEAGGADGAGGAGAPVSSGQQTMPGGPAPAAAAESNNSSMTSVSSAPAGKLAGQQQHQQQPQENIPNQSNPDSKSSESPPSNQQQQQQQELMGGPTSDKGHHAPQTNGHHQHAHHHHHHHHCHHRSHKKRLVLDAGNNQPEAVAKSDVQTQPTAAESSLSCDSGATTRRRPLGDLASGANISAGTGGGGDAGGTGPSNDNEDDRDSENDNENEDEDNDKTAGNRQHHSRHTPHHQHHHHNQHHHHHHSQQQQQQQQQQEHLHHRHHHHHHHAHSVHHCAHHKQQARADGSTPPNADEPGAQQQKTPAASRGAPAHHHHHHHCVHRHHRHHHHHHNNTTTSNNQNHAHHHHHHHQQCKQQRGHTGHRSRQKSVSQTNVDQVSSTRDSNRTLDRSVEAGIGTEPGASGESIKGTEGSGTGRAPEPARAPESSAGCVVQSGEASDDGVVKMETSPPPSSLEPERRKSLAANRLHQAAPVGEPVSGSQTKGADESKQEQQQTNLQMMKQTSGSERDSGSLTGAADEASRMSAREPACELSQETNAAQQQYGANQENLRSGETESETGASEAAAATGQQQQQQANKLTRQMSSQSSRRSDKADAIRGGGPGDLDDQSQSQGEHLRECAERALQPATAINQGAAGGETRQIIESSATTDRRCRLCWCCCCPCSALSTRNDTSNRAIEKPKVTQGPPSSPVGSNYPSLPNVPLDEIRSWGESFDKLMKCSAGRKVFQDFLRCEYSEENILFWAACEELKKEKDSKNIASKARDIYEDYISILSSKEVSLDSRVRDIINNNIKKPTSNIFDEAQLQIYTLMHRDSYPRFINSIMYKKLAQIPVSNSRKSSS